MVHAIEWMSFKTIIIPVSQPTLSLSLSVSRKPKVLPFKDPRGVVGPPMSGIKLNLPNVLII